MGPGANSVDDQFLRFESFELNLTRRTVVRDGIRLKLQPQPFAVLELLISRAPEIVSREDIRRRIWGDNVHVDSGQGIAFCIRQIRLVLGDQSTSPRYIETVPRQGFRFVGKTDAGPENLRVNELCSAEEGSLAREGENEKLPSLPRFQITRPAIESAQARIFLGALGVATLLAVLVVLAFRLFRNDGFFTVAQVSSITTYLGSAQHPCYSPDGRQVTFSWDGEGVRSIYVAHPRAARPLRLTHSAREDDFPVWSPDGKYIAFIRLRDPNGGELMLVPALGGAERDLHQVNFSIEIATSNRMLAWSPDGKWICFSSRDEKSTGREELRLVSPETGESRPMFSISNKDASDSSPAFSPDGHWIAFARFSFPLNSTLLVQPLSPRLYPAGDALKVLGAGINPTSPVWTRDGHSLLFLDGVYRLLQAELSDVQSGRPARQIYVTDAALKGLSFGGSKPSLCTSRVTPNTELWGISLKGHSASERVPRKILASTKASQTLPEYSPDGRWLAFVSNQDGAWQVWVTPTAGEHPRQLTHLANYILGFPRWSPDSKSIAFHARVPADAQLYVVRVSDGSLRQVTSGVPGIAAPSWSSDGNYLYGLGPHNGSEFVFRITLGTGAREVLWEGVRPYEVPGRDLLLYSKIHQLGIFARHLPGGNLHDSEQRLVNDYVDAAGFSAVSAGFYYASTDAAGKPKAFSLYSFDSNKTVDLAPAPKSLSGGFAVSPDQTTLIYGAQETVEADLISLELKREHR